MRNIARVGIVCIVLLLLEHGMAPRWARAGFCGGDRARVAKLVEYLSFKIVRWLKSLLPYTERTIDRGFMLAARLALWNLHQQSIDALSSQLTRSEMDPEKLGQVLRPYWERAMQFGAYAHAGDQNASLSSFQQHMTDQLVEVWSVCRAVRQGEVKPCDTYLRGEALKKCRLLFAKLGTLYRHRCESKRLKEVSQITSQPVDLVERWCRILKLGRPGDLDDATLETIVNEPRDRAAAWAVANDDPQACQSRGLNEADLRYCLGELHTYRFVTGRLPMSKWQPSDQSLFFRAAARAARDESIDCVELTIWAYRSTSVPHFLVVYP